MGWGDFAGNILVPFPGAYSAGTGLIAAGTSNGGVGKIEPLRVQPGGVGTVTAAPGKPKIQVTDQIGGAGGATFQVFHPTTNQPLSGVMPYKSQSDIDKWLSENGWNQPAQGPNQFPTVPTLGASAPPMDPSLGVQALLKQVQDAVDKSNEAVTAANAPIGDAAQTLINPLLPGLKSDINEAVSQQVAANQSDMMKRGATGSSTEMLGSADIRAAGIKALDQGIQQLLFQALPIAMQDKQNKVAAIQGQVATLMEKAKTATSLRSLISDEQFKSLSLDQQANIANADNATKMEIQKIDQDFQTRMTILQQNFQAAQNEADRQVYQQQMNQLKDARDNAQRNSVFKGILTTLGAIGGGMATKTPAGVSAGAAAGSGAADLLGFAMK